MNSYLQCGGCGKAHSVIVDTDGSREVIDWQLGDHKVPAVHRVRAKLVRFPVAYYQHAHYGPEVMAIRSENTARLGWSTQSFNMPLVPEVVGHFNLLTHAVACAYKVLRGEPTKVDLGYPTTITLENIRAGHDYFRIYLNLAAYEFYHLLFVVGQEHLSSQFVVEPVDVRTCPKLLDWLRPFETAKKKLYCENGFDWNPKRGPISPEPT
jgi:hypothetical protein